MGSAATGSAFSFATTYALGQVAKEYYASGRTIDMNQLKGVFASLLEQGKALQSNYAGEIQQFRKIISQDRIGKKLALCGNHKGEPKAGNFPLRALDSLIVLRAKTESSIIESPEKLHATCSELQIPLNLQYLGLDFAWVPNG